MTRTIRFRSVTCIDVLYFDGSWYQTVCPYIQRRFTSVASDAMIWLSRDSEATYENKMQFFAETIGKYKERKYFFKNHVYVSCNILGNISHPLWFQVIRQVFTNSYSDAPTVIIYHWAQMCNSETRDRALDIKLTWINMLVTPTHPIYIYIHIYLYIYILVFCKSVNWVRRESASVSKDSNNGRDLGLYVRVGIFLKQSTQISVKEYVPFYK